MFHFARRHPRAGILAIFAIFLQSCIQLNAQVKTADIVGIVTDNGGAVVPNAKITAQNLSTNEVRSTQTDSAGGYLFTLLPPASYKISAESAGFKTEIIPSVTLAVGDRLKLDLHLAVGETHETVTVSAEATGMQTQTSVLQSTIGEEAVQDLPVNNRNFATLAQLAPGANNSTQGYAGGNGPDDARPTSTVQVNGQSPWYNNFQIDGMNNNERFVGTVIVKPSIEAIQEVQMVTSLYPAELGRTAAAVINLITKSGTNQFHGSAYDYFRNNIFDAPDVLTETVSPYKQNQFGGSLGGPIVKNRTFFFADYEGYRSIQGLVHLASVPTDKMRNGDFSDLFLPENGDIQIYDPITSLPYPGNIIPKDPSPGQTGQDPVGYNLLNLYPRSTSPDRSLASNNFVSAPSRTLDTDTFDVKIDHRFSDGDSVFARYSFEHLDSVIPGAYPAGDAYFGGPTTERPQGAQINYVHVFGPDWITELRIGYDRYKVQSYTYNKGKDLAQEAGLTGSNYDSLSTGLPWIYVVGESNIGNSFYEPELNTNDIYQISGSTTHMIGLHSIKFGGEIRRTYDYQYQSSFATGGFVFVGITGNAYADFMTGIPSPGQSPGRNVELFTPPYRYNEESVFAQDDWRVRTWLTLNLGLRYDYYSPVSSDPGKIATIDAANGRTLVSGENGVSNTAGVGKDWRDINPHLGFAATFGRTVVRGGFGISYVPPFMGSNGAMRNGPVISGWAVPSGWRLQDGMPLPLVPNSVTNPTGSDDAIRLDYRTPYVEQVNLTIQRQLPAKLIGTVSYLANLGRQQYAPDNALDANLPGNGQSVRPYAAIDPNLTYLGLFGGYSNTNYQGMQATLGRHFSSGLGATVNYTWSHSFDNFPYQPTATPSGGIAFVLVKEGNVLDVRQRATFMLNYRLPFAKNTAGLKAVAAKGWQLNLIGQVQTSLPYTLTNGNAIAIPSTGVDGTTEDVPNEISNPFKAGPVMANPDPACHSTISQGGIAPDRIHTKATWFNVCAFAQQPIGTWGDEGLNSLYGPRFVDFDTSISKNFSLSEGVTLQFSAQAFNQFNHPDWQVTQTSFNGASPNAGGLGQAASEANYYVSRNLQFALKLTF